MNKRTILLTSGLAAFFGCTTTPHHQAESQHFSRKLSLGMTKAEVEALGGKPGNCQGNPSHLEKCEVVFWTGYASQGIPIATQYSVQKYDTYLMTFQEGKLSHWEKHEDKRLQGAKTL